MLSTRCCHSLFNLVATLAMLSLAVPNVKAQIVPNSGSLERESRQELLPKAAALRLPPAKPASRPAEGVSVLVKNFRINGASLIPSDRLHDLLANRIGNKLTLAELEAACRQLSDYYYQQGWFARAYLPPQDVTEGEIQIQLVEGRLGDIQLEQAQEGSLRTNTNFVMQVISRRLIIGQPLSAKDLERGLLLANDLPGVEANGVLAAGEQEGDTNLLVTIKDRPLLSGDLGVNNHGIKATGPWQLFGGLALNNPSGRGDLLDLHLQATERLHSGQLSYTTPIGLNGSRLGLRYFGLDYRLGEQFRALDAKGDAAIWGLDLSHPLIRSDAANLQLYSSIEKRSLNDDMLGSAIRKHRIEALTLGLAGDNTDDWQGGGGNSLSLNLTSGDLDLSAVAADRAADRAGPRTQGGYTKLQGQMSRLQYLAPDLSLCISLGFQIANTNLDSSEKFSLGGPRGIRAYPVGEAAGDEGWLLKLELRKELQPGLTAIGFVDGGEIDQYKNTWKGWRGQSKTPNHYGLAGAGIGLVMARTDWQAQLTIATPLGDNPGASKGKNQDGSTQEARGWLMFKKTF